MGLILIYGIVLLVYWVCPKYLKAVIFRFLTSISRNRKMKVNEIQEIKRTKTQADYPMLLCGHNGDGVCGNCRCEPQHGEQLVQ